LIHSRLPFPRAHLPVFGNIFQRQIKRLYRGIVVGKMQSEHLESSRAIGSRTRYVSLAVFLLSGRFGDAPAEGLRGDAAESIWRGCSTPKPEEIIRHASKLIRHAASDTVATYALSEEQATRKSFWTISNEPQ
jgi:hypothetical protein